MCFSAPASLIAGVSLCAAGALTTRRAQRKSELPFATIPVLFGVQQLIEGAVWISFRFDNPSLHTAATYAYVLFAYLLWPTFIPFAVGALETVPWRKKMISVLQVIGIAVSMYYLYFIVTSPITSQVTNRCISYTAPHFYISLAVCLYAITTCFSCLFSSDKVINTFGVLGLFSLVIAYQFYTNALVSVWCFFAAILSFIVYLYFQTKYGNARSWLLTRPTSGLKDQA